MRTIKFRGKGFYDGRWYYGDLIHDEKLTSIRFLVNNPDVNNVEITVIPETVGQFTGLTDKNGVEIYEGDILDWNHAAHDDDKGVSRVVFRDCGFGFEIGFGGYSLECFMRNDEEQYVVIIGNIHDNPELLK